jgi:acetoin:2,6-dichlorophenolindophenol oxidoreductase subunit alpha
VSALPDAGSKAALDTEGIPGVVGMRADDATALAYLYASMLFVRKFEEAAQSSFLRGLIFGSIHLAMGQEAVSAGVCSALRQGDLVAATYRGHCQALSLGVDPTAFMSELMGKETGICGGRAGSMNIADPKHGLLGCFGIVGGSIAAATGAALTQKIMKTGHVAVAFFGDGAANQGYFLECLNFAAVRRLPVLFVCENNGYGEFTATGAVTAGSIASRPRAMGIWTREADGQDVAVVGNVAAEALGHVRAGGGPAFIEAFTYRYNDHARGDPINYRPMGEMERWKSRDPIAIGRNLAVDAGASPAVLDHLDEIVAGRVKKVVRQAKDAPMPSLHHLRSIAEFFPSGDKAAHVED